MRSKNFLLQSFILLLLSSILHVVVADTGESGLDRDLDFKGSDCIWIRTIRDYDRLDDRTLLIWSGSRPYFVELTTGSRETRSLGGMRVESNDDQLCPYGGDTLSFGGLMSFPVRVQAISRISREQAEELKVHYGKSDNEKPKTPAPRELKGADVIELD